MAKLLDQAIEAIKGMPPARQDAIARFVLEVVHDEPAEAIPLEHRAAVLEGLAEADRGEFASDEEIEAAFRRFRP